MCFSSCAISGASARFFSPISSSNLIRRSYLFFFLLIMLGTTSTVWAGTWQVTITTNAYSTTSTSGVVPGSGAVNSHAMGSNEFYTYDGALPLNISYSIDDTTTNGVTTGSLTSGPSNVTVVFRWQPSGNIYDDPPPSTVTFGFRRHLSVTASVDRFCPNSGTSSVTANFGNLSANASASGADPHDEDTHTDTEADPNYIFQTVSVDTSLVGFAEFDFNLNYTENAHVDFQLGGGANGPKGGTTDVAGSEILSSDSASFSMDFVMPNYDWQRWGGAGRGAAGGQTQSGGDPSFTRWLPLSFSPTVNSQPFRYVSGSPILPAPWGNVSCAYGIRLNQEPPTSALNSDLDWQIIGYYVDPNTAVIVPLFPQVFIPKYAITDSTGDRLLFGGSYTGNQDVHSTLTALSPPGSGWQLANAGPPGSIRELGHYTYTFDGSGRLTKIADDAGNSQTITFGTSPPSMQVTDSSSGRHINFSYNAQGYISEMDAPEIGSGTHTQTTLGYDGTGHLTSVKVFAGGSSTPLHTDTFTYGGPNGDSVLTSSQGVSYSSFGWVSDNENPDPFGLPTPRMSSMTLGSSGDSSSSDNGGSIAGNYTFTYGPMSGYGTFGRPAQTNTTTDARGNAWQTYLLFSSTSGSKIYGEQTIDPDYTGAPANSNLTKLLLQPNMDYYTSGSFADQLNHTTLMQFSSTQQLTSLTDPLNNTWSWGYVGGTGPELQWAKDPTLQQVTFTYGTNPPPSTQPLHRLIDVTSPTLHASYVYNNFDQPITLTANGRSIGITYDNTTGDVTKLTDNLGNAETVAGYDALGDPGSTTVYPDTGNPTTSHNPLTTTLTWDAAQFLEQMTGPSGVKSVTTLSNGIPVMEQAYAPAGAGGGLLAQTGFSIDTRGRVYSIADLVGIAMQYRYDKNSNLTKVLDGNGNTTLFSYGAANEPTGVTWPDGHSTQPSYDAAGRLTKDIDERNIETDYLYDFDDRLTDIQFHTPYAGQNTHFTYDNAGRMLSVTDASGGRTFNLDTVKRIGSETVTVGGHANSLSYTYNSDQTVLSVQTPADTTSYTYDGDGRIQTVSDGVGDTTTYSYDHAGRMTGTSLTTGAGNITTTTFTWGVSGQAGDPSTAPAYLHSVYQTKLGHGFQTYSLVNSYLGQILSEGGAGGSGDNDSEAYTYDARGRLSGENITYQDTGHTNHTVTATYGYDLSGNLMAGSGWTYNTSNQVTAAPVEPGLAGASSFVYDAAGNITSLSGVTLGYDVWGNLTSAGSATYAYDSSGRRVSKTVGGVTTYYLWDGDLLMAEEDASGNITHSYTWGPTGLISDRVGGVTRFYLYDAQGNTRTLLDASGNVLGRATYSSWGSVIYSTLPSNCPFGWQGAEGAYTDPESGLVYLHNRYYAPALGRFLTRDPSGFSGGINLYAYCFDDPINYDDPLGLDPPGDDDGNYSMRSFHPGMKAGTDQSNLANQMLENLKQTLMNAAFDAAGGGFGIVGDEAIATADADQLRSLADEIACFLKGGCFLAGTMVQTEHGMVPIEKIKAGDKVYTRPDSTDAKASVSNMAATTELKPVISTTSLKADRVLHVQLADASGKIVDTLTVTRNHPFFVDGKGFVPAGGLAVGNAIVTRAGSPVTVKSIQWERSAQGYTVYNLLVQDDHTYFVGNGQEWVHNGRKKCEGMHPNASLAQKWGNQAEVEWREWLEQQEVKLVPKKSSSSPGPDGIVHPDSEVNLGWDYAELKPDTPKEIAKGWKQLIKRVGQGYKGKGVMYIWTGSPGNFKFWGPNIQKDMSDML